MDQLVKDIKALDRKAKRNSLVPVVRLNGTSDLAWEKFSVTVDGVKYRNLMLAFPHIQFYDYTKIASRKAAAKLPNYHLTFSLSENNDSDSRKALGNGMNVAMVVKMKRKDLKPSTVNGIPVIDGDKHDLRFVDPKGGHIVMLRAKARANNDTSGFVRNMNNLGNIIARG